MPDLGQVRESLSREFEVLEFEVSTLSRVFKETRFFGHPSNFPHAHYGYLMACMAKIDMLSSYWSGQVGSKGQTQRMRAFMEKYLYPGKAGEIQVAVQMFRHTLMHTGALRFLYDRKADARYTWRVYLDALPPHFTHFTITDEDPTYQDQLLAPVVSTGSTTRTTKALNVSIPVFAADLRRAMSDYLEDLAAESVLQTHFDRADAHIIIQEFD